MKTVPTGFSGVPPPGPAMPVTASAKSEPNFSRAPRAISRRHRLAHRAVLRQSFRAHTEEFFLRRIRIAHHAARKNCRRARHVRHPLRDAAARAGFRQRQGFLLFRQQPHHDLLNFVIVKSENIFAAGFFARPPRLRSQVFPPSRRRPPAAHPPRRAARSNRLPIRAARAATNQLPTISCTRDSPMPVVRNVRQTKISSAKFAPQQRHDRVIKHRPQFARRPGQHYQASRADADGRSPSPRCESASNGERAGVRCRLFSILHLPSSSTRMASPGAVPVGFRKNQRAFGHQGFHAGFRRARPAAFGEKIFDVREHVLVFNQFFAEQSGDQFTGEVIRSRPQPAGRDDQIRAAQRLAHGLLDLISVIRQPPPAA